MNSQKSKPVLFRITNNLKVGGVQRRLRALLPLLTERYEVHIVTYKVKGVFFDELAELGVHTHFMPRKGHWSPVAIWKLAQLFRKHKADIVHTHSFGGNIFGILAAALARVPVRIGQMHSRGLHWYGSTALRRKKQIFEEKLVHRLFSHKVLFVSRESKKYFQSQTGLPESMLQVLYNGLHFPAKVERASRAELNIPENKTLIGFVGRLTKGKGVERFVEMAEEASRQAPGRFHFTIIGDGERLAGLKEWTQEHGLTHEITFLGERSDIHRCYAALDMLVSCSDPDIEGMPGVVLEACAHGLPILAIKDAPLEEIREHYERIFFINTSEPIVEQIDKALLQPRVDPSKFFQEFSIEAMRDRTISVYESLSLEKVT